MTNIAKIAKKTNLKESRLGNRRSQERPRNVRKYRIIAKVTRIFLLAKNTRDKYRKNRKNNKSNKNQDLEPEEAKKGPEMSANIAKIAKVTRIFHVS